MMQRNVHTKYRPSTGSISSLITQKKSKRFHIKFLWSVNLALATFVALKFIQGDASGQSQGNVQEVKDESKTSCIVPGLLDSVQLLDVGQSQGNAHELQNASKTSCIVLGFLDSVQLLDMDHHVYFDNYYNSSNLIDLLYKRKIHACGTVRKNQKSLPLAVTQAKLKNSETVFHHKTIFWH